MADSSRPRAGARTTAADVALRAGVSRATVGYVLNGTPGQTISAETVRRVREAAVDLDYRPHRSAQALARGASDVVLVILPSWTVVHSFSETVEAASTRLAERGYALVTQARESAGARPVWQAVEPLVVARFTPFTDDEVHEMRAGGVQHIVEVPTSSPAETAGARLQFNHLYALGHRTVGYAVTSDPRDTDIRVSRSEAFADAAADVGVVPFIESIDAAPGAASHAVGRWRDAGVTAVAAFDDETAAVVVRAAHDLGLSVPHDLAVIGHDDSPLARLYIPSLSSVAIDAPAYGRYLADFVLARMTDGAPAPTDYPDYTLTRRESTAL
jgi:DNA-binding LacI/PurR family transcriptional regulator